MGYIYQILAVILIAISAGAYAGDRRFGMLVPSAIAVACAAVVLATQLWWPLVLGLAAFVAAQVVQRDDFSTTHRVGAH